MRERERGTDVSEVGGGEIEKKQKRSAQGGKVVVGAMSGASNCDKREPSRKASLEALRAAGDGKKKQ